VINPYNFVLLEFRSAEKYAYGRSDADKQGRHYFTISDRIAIQTNIAPILIRARAAVKAATKGQKNIFDTPLVVDVSVVVG
jgi:hypothetical protein